eukprot:GSChrysophyteH1.ASY1.ANO1.1921.1 assembled CDS
MKYLEVPSLDEVSMALTDRELGIVTVNGAIHLYSFPSRKGKHNVKVENENFAVNPNDQMRRRPGKSRSMSLGDWSNQNSAHRILLELTSTLNESFPDYDFSQAKTSSFVVFTVDTVIRTVNNYFSDLQNEEDPKFLENLWAALDTEVKLSRCEVYSYVPDMDGDPFSEESIWSFNYFFIDRELRKIAYFTCVACTTLHKDADASDYQTDSDAGNLSPVSPSPDVYGFYGSPTRTSTVSDSEEHSPRDHNIAMQEEESDSDEMA